MTNAYEILIVANSGVIVKHISLNTVTVTELNVAVLSVNLIRQVERHFISLVFSVDM
jgi:hypothetical protein